MRMTLVTTNGCFDRLHPGHVAFLTDARALGDRLIVGLNGDRSVRRLKGPDRPFLPATERAMMLRALRCVDDVVIFEDDLPDAFLRAVVPAIHCKGGDYREDMLPEAALVRSLGGRIAILPLHGPWSTTRLAAGAVPSEERSTTAVHTLLSAGSHLLRRIDAELAGAIGAEAVRMARVIAAGGRILVCGNGGSAADAQHFAAELVGRFGSERRALPAVSLASDVAVLTAIANDYGYEHVFARQIEAIGREGDVLLAISASGRSQNVLNAVDAARARGVATVALTGFTGQPLADRADRALIVPAEDVPVIQQGHRAVLHALCAAIEGAL